VIAQAQQDSAAFTKKINAACDASTGNLELCSTLIRTAQGAASSWVYQTSQYVPEELLGAYNALAQDQIAGLQQALRGQIALSGSSSFEDRSAAAAVQAMQIFLTAINGSGIVPTGGSVAAPRSNYANGRGVTNDSSDILPGMSRPPRPPNPVFPPDPVVADAMTSPRIKNMAANNCYIDCSEISEALLKSAGGKGQILEVLPKTRGTLNVFENGKMEPDQYYHQVYTDGRYVYDPRLSPRPITQGDWLQHINNINPGGVTISTTPKGLQ
jgi:hypothetical protein